jgi:ribosomal protein L9
MQVILLEDVPSLGKLRSMKVLGYEEIIYPQKKAMPATEKITPDHQKSGPAKEQRQKDAERLARLRVFPHSYQTGERVEPGPQPPWRSRLF